MPKTKGQAFKSLVLILMIVLLILMTAAFGNIFMALLRMSAETEFHLRMTEISAAATTSSSFQEHTVVAEHLPSQCEELRFWNHTLRGVFHPADIFYTTYVPPDNLTEDVDIRAECGFIAGVVFENGRIKTEVSEDYV